MDYPNFSQTHMAKIVGAFQSPHMETPPFLDHFCRETMVFSYLISMLIFNFPEVIEMTNIVGRFYQPPLDRRREAYWTLLRSEDNSPISRSQVFGYETSILRREDSGRGFGVSIIRQLWPTMTLTVEGIIRNHLNHIQNFACRFVKHTQEFNFARYLAACSSFKFGTRHRLHSSGSCPNKDRTVWKRNACFFSWWYRANVYIDVENPWFA